MLIKNYSEATQYITDILTQHLKRNERVLWLIPGGSAISIAVDVSHALTEELKKNLTISLTDERYGALNHADSNWFQLSKAGFDFSGVTQKPVLIGLDRTDTTRHFDETLSALQDGYDYSLGFFGIGPDGHTAGILPGSAALQSKHYAADYDASNFERITMTPTAIAALDEAVAYAVGDTKWPILKQLQTELPVDIQPAQLLKNVRKLTIFTDYKGE